MKKKSIKTAIIIPMLIGIIIGISVLAIISGVRAANIADRLTAERVYGASRAAAARLDNLEDQSLVVALAAASNYTVTNNLRNWNEGTEREQSRQNLINYLTNTAREMKVDSFIVRDVNGEIVLRLYAPGDYEQYDDSPYAAAAVQRALRGEVTTKNYSSMHSIPMALISTAPIWNGGQISGTISSIIYLHTNEFVDYIAGIFNAQVAVFSGNERVATTLTDNSGQRIVGTRIDGPAVEAVLYNGRSFDTEMTLHGNRYKSNYFPLTGLDGTPVGMFYIGFSTAYADGALAELIRDFVIIGIIILIGVVVVLYIVVHLRTKKLPVITAAAEAIAIGDVEIEGLDDGTEPTNNEIIKLERSFSAMMASFKQQAYILARVAEGDYTSKVQVRSEKDVINLSIELMLNETLEVLNKVSSAGLQVADSSRQIAEGAQSLAQGSVEQSQLVETIVESANKGSRQMDDLMASVTAINEASQDIIRVMKLIDSIASTTNILALNASVESARAGEYGKSFSVVAEEVRSLAAQTAKASEETKSMIENSIAKTEIGFKLAGETAASLNQITTEIVKVADVVHKNSATAEEAAASAQEMRAQSALLDDMAQQFLLREQREKNK